MNKKSDLPEFLTKGGPGDRSTPGHVNTEEWWKRLDEEGQEIAKKEGSVVQQATNKDIYFCTIPFTQIYSEIGPGKVVASETLKSILNAPPCQSSGSIIKSGFLPSFP